MNTPLSKPIGSGIGVTLLLAGLVFGALISTKGPAIPQHLVYLSEGFETRFWTIVTFPFIDIDLPHALASIVMLVIFGRDLEAEMGTLRLLSLWFASSILFAIGSTLAFAPHHIPGIATGAWVPVGSFVVAWCVRRPVSRLRVTPPVAAIMGIAISLGICTSIGKSMPTLGIAAALSIALGAVWAKVAPRRNLDSV